MHIHIKLDGPYYKIDNSILGHSDISNESRLFFHVVGDNKIHIARLEELKFLLSVHGCKVIIT